MNSFIPYLVFSTVHVILCGENNQKFRAFTKIFLMPLLSLGAFLCGIRDFFVFLALLFGWAGDIVLIKPQEYKEKVTGSSFFAVGHAMYLIAILRKLLPLGFKTWNYFVVIFFAAVGFVIFSLLKKNIDERMKMSCMAYFVLLGAMLGIAICAVAAGVLGVALVFGYALFIASDTVLVNQWFTVGDPYPRKDVAVMITYCLAQLFNILSFR